MSPHPLYLETLTIKNFRTLGDFRLDLPAGPGVTVISGTNGLGKTNIFGAMEWALTGEIRRFVAEKARGVELRDALRRDRQFPPEVELLFSDGSQVLRTEAGVTPEDHIAFLMAEGWPKQMFNSAFRFTHLLDQSAKQQMVRMGDSERWTYVGSVTRLHEVWQVRKKIGPNFARKINEMIATAKADIEQANIRAQNWQDLLQRRERLTELARASQALFPEQAEDVCNRLLARLDEVAGPQDRPKGELSQRVAALHANLNDAQRSTHVRLASLTARREDIAAYAARQANVESLISELSTALEAERDAQELCRVAGNALREAEETENKAKEMRATLSLRVERLTSLRTLLRENDELERRLAAERERIEQAGTRLKAAKDEDQRLRVLERRATASADHAAQAETQVKRAETLKQRLGDLAVLEYDHKAKVTAWTEAEARINSLRTTHDELHQGLEGVNERVAQAEARLVSARQKADIVANAVAAIAEAIDADRCDCPICQTKFTGGRLKELARQSANEASPDLAAEEEQTQRLRKEQADLRVELASAKDELDALLALEGQKSAAELAWLRAANALTAEPELAGVADLQAKVDALLQEAAEARTAALAEVQATGTPEAARHAVTRHAEVLAGAQKEEDAARATVDSTIAEIEDCQNSIAAVVALLGVSGEPKEKLAEVFAAATAELQAADDKLRELQELVGERRKAVGTADQCAAQIRFRLAELEAKKKAELNQIEEIGERWRTAGLGTVIDHETLARAMDVEGERLTNLTVLSHSLGELLAGMEGWERAQELRDCDAEISQLLRQEECADVIALDRKLSDMLAQKEGRLSRLKALNERRTEIQRRVGEQSEKIQSETLAPLNGCLNAFNTALVTQQSHEMRLECNFGAGASTGIKAADINGDEVRPELYLSEGQLGAVNLGLLLSANLTYRWSKWPAVLIDDPLQYADIVNASAFMDVLCNLVRQRNLQVILSTHDPAQADFCLRKCRAANVDTCLCQLLAQSQEGVQYELH